jgi:hypothetical protein
MLINFAYNPHLVNKPPKLPYVAHRANWRRINGGFINKRGRPETLAKLIKQGYPYTSAHRRYRHKRNFIKGQVLSLDFDHDGFDTLLNDTFINTYAYFIYNTPSSTADNPRSRAVFVLPHAVDQPILFGAMAQGLVEMYGDADESCKDPARIFFGSLDCNIVTIGNVLPNELMEEIASDVLKREQEHQSYEPIVNNISSETVRDAVMRQIERIQFAAPGEKHGTRLAVGTTVGGYVAAGYLSYQEASSYLLQAAISNTSAPRLAEKDVLDGLSYGMSNPLCIPPKTFADYGIEI